MSNGEWKAGLLVGAGLLASAALVLPGCPENSCILKVCTNGRCRCSISSCQDGAAYDTRQNRCRCLKGTIPLAGQCLSPEAANAYCGKGYHFDNSTIGCVRSTCKPGDELDEATGMCIPHDQVAQVGRNMGVPVGAGEKLGCPPGTKLVIDGPKAACVPLSETCARDESWTGQACAKVVHCPTGSIWDTSLRQCVQYAQGGGSKELSVNIAQWASANYGPHGGQGTAAFCGQFSKKPWSFGVVEGQTAILQINVMLSFPGGEVAKGIVQTTTVFAASGNPVPARGGSEVDAAARSIFATLQQGGGRATSSTANTSVKCAVTNSAKPVSVPATGGA